MDKDLLDISGRDENNCILKNTPKKGVTSFADGGNSGRERSYFDCSPLQIPRSSRAVPNRSPFSSIGRVTGNNSNMEQLSPCIDTGSVGKENISGSSVELTKLSVERQQMKKKKKNAGFNLRKSLAWDRAFSTEEGVLDTTELFKITGNACLVGGGDLLPAIQEESMSASKCTSVSPGLQALEEHLFNDLPVNSKKREKKIVTGTVPKYASPSKTQSSMAQKKIVSAQGLRSGSKRSDCPRPPPSSSLKRPANVHTTTPRSRELGVSKVSKTISEPVTVANNMKRTTQSPSKPKLSQLTQPRNSQRSLGSVSFSKITSSTKSKTKSSLASKSSIPKPSLKQSRRNVITKTSAVPSVSKSQHSVVGMSNDGPTTTSDVDMLGHASNTPDSDVTNMDTTLAQNSRVGNTQSAISRLVKPSGLRLPSPSIGYFDQSGSQPSHNAEEKHSRLPRSDVSSASRFSLIPTFKKPQFSENNPRVNSKSATGNIGSSGSAAGFSAQDRVKVGWKSTREIEHKVSNESLLHCITPGDICTSENISTAKCEDFQSSSELPLSRRSDDDADEQRKTCCSVEGPLIEGSMDSPMQGPSGPYGHELTWLEVRNQGEEDICTMNSFNGDLDTMDVHGEPQTECVHPGDEDEMRHFLSGEKDVLIVNHSTENVAKQPEVLKSLTADPNFLGDFASRKSDVDDLSSEDQLGIFVPSGPAERLNQDTNLSKISDGMSNQDSNSGCIEYNHIGKAKVQTDTEKDFSTQVTDPEFGPHEEGEVRFTKISPDPVKFVTREEESGAPIPMNEAFSVRDDMQPNEFTVLSDDTLTSESNGVHASEKYFRAQVTDQELSSYGEEEVQVISISPDPVVYVTREEEPGTPIPMNEAFSFRDNMQPNDDNLTSESSGVHASESSSDCTCSSEGKDKTILMDAKIEKKPDPIIVKPPNAVPFSDEWLAAIESAGEEILTLKTGRVQHSPTDKYAPEPGPWSPVKKKNNQRVGPFDCTKFTNKGPPALD